MDRTPRGYEARIAAEAGTAAARKADHEREAITGRIPHLDALDGSDDAAELHGAPQERVVRRIHNIAVRLALQMVDRLSTRSSRLSRLLPRLGPSQMAGSFAARVASRLGVAPVECSLL